MTATMTKLESRRIRAHDALLDLVEAAKEVERCRGRLGYAEAVAELKRLHAAVMACVL